MPALYSNDLRKRIIESKLKGIPESQIAADKNVHKNPVTKLWDIYRETGSYEPRPNHNGRKPVLSAEQLENVKNTIIARPDITLLELIEEHSLAIGISGLCKIVKNLGFRYKKTLYPSEQQREDVKIEREEYTARQSEMKVKKLVFLDKSSINTGMTRHHSRALGGERVVDYAYKVKGVAEAINTVTKKDIVGWFRESKYKYMIRKIAVKKEDWFIVRS